MNAYTTRPRLVRYPDKGLAFGVCAGLAQYYGWRTRNLRFAVVALALLLSWPVLLAYLIAVFVLPNADDIGASAAGGQDGGTPGRGPQSVRPDYVGPLKERYARIEARMRQVEAYLHGHEYQLRTAFKDLEN